MTSFALLDDPRYMVDSDGNVYGPKRKLKPTPAVGGKYQTITVGKSDTRYVHRLVAEAFIPNPDNKPDVAHNNGNGLDNRVENLRWATESENMADKDRHGTHTKGDRHGNVKLSDSSVARVRYLRAQGATALCLAHEFGVSVWTIYDACNESRRKLA